MKIAIPTIHYLAILPAILLLASSVGLLFATALMGKKISTQVASFVTVLTGAGVLVVTFLQWSQVANHGASTTIANAIVLDGFSVVSTGIIAIGLILSTFVAHDWSIREKLTGAEFHMLALASTTGAVLMTQANDLIVIFLGLEILSIGLYVLVAFDRHRAKGQEAALKYFLLGGFASALFIYGAALVYGATGTTNLSSISYFLGSNLLLHPGLLYAGGGLLLVGFGFKVAAVPFHLWSPDVYVGAPSPVTGFMASIVKVGAFAALLRVMISALGTQLDTWRPILWAFIALSAVLGASLGLIQRNVKRMLAYSSINHTAFILLGVWAGTARGTGGALFYLMAYVPAVIGSFAVVSVVGGLGDDNHDVSAYSGLGTSAYTGLARRQPLLAGAFVILLLSQLGAPGTTGFYAKFAVLEAAIEQNGPVIALIAIVSAAIAAFFYLRWCLVLFSSEETTTTRVGVTKSTAFVIIFSVVTTLAFGIWPGPLASLAQHAGLLFTP